MKLSYKFQFTYNLPINKYMIWYKPFEHIDARKIEVPGTQNFAILDGLCTLRENIFYLFFFF